MDKETVLEVFRRYVDVLELNNWLIYVTFKKLSSAAACNITYWSYKLSDITFDNENEFVSEDTVDRIVTHELLHCLFANLVESLENIIENFVDEERQDDILSTMSMIYEKLINDLARIIVKLSTNSEQTGIRLREKMSVAAKRKIKRKLKEKKSEDPPSEQALSTAHWGSREDCPETWRRSGTEKALSYCISLRTRDEGS